MRPWLRFYVRGAARIAQRNALLTFALAIQALVFLPDAPRVLRMTVSAVTASDAPRLPALALAVFALPIAGSAARTLRLGLGGWIRSLPYRSRDMRRAFALALVVPLAPLFAWVGIGFVLTPTAFGQALHVPSLLGFPLGMLGAAAAAVPTGRRALGLLCAGTAALVWSLGTWWALLATAAALAAWDLVAGPVVPAARPPEHTRLLDRWILPRLSFRALGAHAVVPALFGLLFLACAWLYRTNNGLSRPETSLAMRLALFTAVLLGNLVLAERLLERRRPWPWSRSLPLSSRRRVIDDSLVFALPHLPTLVFAAWLDPLAALVGLAALPTLCLLSAGALRRASGKLTGTGAGISASLLPFVVLGVLYPWTAAVALALTPSALRLSVRAERRWVATAWDPLHHDASGDSLSEVYR